MRLSRNGGRHQIGTKRDYFGMVDDIQRKRKGARTAGKERAHQILVPDPMPQRQMSGANLGQPIWYLRLVLMSHDWRLCDADGKRSRPAIASDADSDPCAICGIVSAG
jgi:hypothetical protein